MRPTITREFLFDYFAGRITSLQKEMVDEWAKDPAHEELFYEYLHEWELQNPQYQANIPKAIDQYRQLLYQPQSLPEPEATTLNQRPPHSRSRWLGWTVAASVLILLSLGAWFSQDYFFFQTYATAYGETRLVSLADGSQVALNANSSLKVPRFGFGKNTRQVFLTGEANFSIVHTQDNQRFVVKTDSFFEVEVLGTEFTVSARAPQTKVVLTKGKVKVHYRKTESPTEQLIMAPGDLITLNKQGQLRLKRVIHPENYAAWKNGRFVFENTTISEIIELLKNNYGLDVEVKGKRLMEQTLTGSFKAITADELLQALSEILEINVIRQDNQVIFIDKH
ncbi:MAG: FecR domain-containing protein [Bacteroidota bacterium]